MDCAFAENDDVSCLALGLLHIVPIEFLILSVYHVEAWSKVDLVGAWHHTETSITGVLVSEHERSSDERVPHSVVLTDILYVWSKNFCPWLD